ncbi:MAG: hypothetical protein IPM29_19890 [Planctomycetes bacterium]|nr:hypothetical protein [Planctomycetota bacterium]
MSLVPSRARLRRQPVLALLLLGGCASDPVPTAELDQLATSAAELDRAAAQTFERLLRFDREMQVLAAYVDRTTAEDDRVESGAGAAREVAEDEPSGDGEAGDADLAARLGYRTEVFALLGAYAETLRALGSEDYLQDARTQVHRMGAAATRAERGAPEDDRSIHVLGGIAERLGRYLIEKLRRDALIDVMSEANDPLAVVAHAFHSDLDVFASFVDASRPGSQASAIAFRFRGVAESGADDPSDDDSSGDGSLTGWQGYLVEREVRKWQAEARDIWLQLQAIDRALERFGVAHDEVLRYLTERPESVSWDGLAALIIESRRLATREAGALGGMR